MLLKDAHTEYTDKPKILNYWLSESINEKINISNTNTIYSKFTTKGINKITTNKLSNTISKTNN